MRALRALLALALWAITGAAALAASSYPLVTPNDWAGYTGGIDSRPGYVSGTRFSQTVFGYPSHEYDVIGPKQPWSISAPDADTVRFELREYDQSAFDVSNGKGSERDELGASYDGKYGGITQSPPGWGRIPMQTPIHLHYGMTVEPGRTNSASWIVLQQLHEDQVSGSPEFSVQFKGGTDIMQIWIGRTETDGTNDNFALWTDPAGPLVRGQRYQMEEWIVVDPNGAGRLIVQRDGVTIVDYSGTLGYTGMTNAFWKVGLYRHGPTPETIAEDIDHMFFEWGSGVVMPTSTPLGLVGGSQLTLGSSFRVSVHGNTGKRTMVSLMVDGRALTSAPSAADGSITFSMIPVPKDGTPRVVSITADGKTASMTLKAVEGVVKAF